MSHCRKKWLTKAYARSANAIQEKLGHLNDAFLFERSIDIDTYDRNAGKLREEPTSIHIDRHYDNSANST